ncbi:MAG: hypothetical protein FJ110_00075 [Deltaproteobacteria bacterium]|nr:hypothetical protein [Deltaproteobacteria bacterium]
MRTYKGNLVQVIVVILSVFLMPGVGAAAEIYKGPILDAHSHVGESFDWETMVSVMDRNNVSRQIIMARGYPGPSGSKDLPGNDDLALKLSDKYPGRFLPLVGMQRTELTGEHKWRNPDAAVNALLKETEVSLATGRFRGIGEVIVRHYAYSSGKHAEMENPIYSPFMLRLSQIAARFDVPIVLHMEGEPGFVKDFTRLLQENPRVRYIWAHSCGRSKAPVIRTMLTNHSNLFCDLSSMTNVGETGYGTGWPRMEAYNALIEQNGVIFPEMREIYEAFPDRFMIGTDVAHAPGMNQKNYGRRIQRFRELLAQLKPQTAAAFAEDNAIRIFKVDR